MKISSSSPGSRTAAFTMMEIAICLAIIGFALVAIIGVLPYGMHTQRNNHDETIINQDATLLLESIRSGARSRYTTDLTNYVYAITNTWTILNPDQSVKETGADGYTHLGAVVKGASRAYLALTNDANIIGLLSTPEYTDGTQSLPDLSTKPIPSVIFGGTSNHIVAYVHSLSGLAVEKPPQNNQFMLQGTFSYQVICVNAPAPAATNVFRDFNYPLWQAQVYLAGKSVLYDWTYWQAAKDTLASDVPGTNGVGLLVWDKVPNYELDRLANLRELRLRFDWPQRPNGTVGDSHQNFRVDIAGQLTTNAVSPQLYYYQSQSFLDQP